MVSRVSRYLHVESLMFYCVLNIHSKLSSSSQDTPAGECASSPHRCLPVPCAGASFGSTSARRATDVCPHALHFKDVLCRPQRLERLSGCNNDCNPAQVPLRGAHKEGALGVARCVVRYSIAHWLWACPPRRNAAGFPTTQVSNGHAGTSRACR